MPELPELEVYVKRLNGFLAKKAVREIRMPKPFVLRTVDPPLDGLVGGTVTGVRRSGKRLVIAVRMLDGDVELFIHLMRSGRLHWVRDKRLHRSNGCAELRFEDGWSLQMTESAKRKQASIHVYRAGDADAADEDVALDPMSKAFSATGLAERLRRRNRQLKGALTDRSVIAGIGNAYSDEILFDARLSPLILTHKLSSERIAELHASIGRVLERWIRRIDELTPGRLPTHQPTWRKTFAVHGRFQASCPRCGTPVARISFAESETNYCPTCQTGGKTLADRRISRLFRR